MNFNSTLSLVGGLPWFDLPTLTQLSGENKASVIQQLSRWGRSGRLISLRRNLYALNPPYRRTPISIPALAQALYRPSYLSGLWALAFYSLIPERVVTYTSVTTRVTREFKNPLGTFRYSNLKKSSFFGYQTSRIEESEVQLATPEKALLDHWHLSSGEWTLERMQEMRYQNQNLVNPETLQAFAIRFKSPRLIRAVQTFLHLAEEESEGTITL